jgi:hypothetical protein
MSETIEPRYSDVHTEHCCAIHGCKYGYDDEELVAGFKWEDFGFKNKPECTVTTGQHSQTYPCEYCYEAGADEERFVRRDGVVVRVKSELQQLKDQLEVMTNWCELLEKFAADTAGTALLTEIRNDRKRAYELLLIEG